LNRTSGNISMVTINRQGPELEMPLPRNCRHADVLMRVLPENKVLTTRSYNTVRYTGRDM
jgi:hypothetical protein